MKFIGGGGGVEKLKERNDHQPVLESIELPPISNERSLSSSSFQSTIHWRTRDDN